MNRKFALVPLLFISAIAYANTAVSEINGKIDSAYGNLDSTDAWINGGSFSAPVAEAFGVQLDALYADIGEDDFGGIGGHFFWRDNELGLVGLTAGGIWSNDIESYEISLEGEYYYGLLTFGAKAGYTAIEYDNPVPFIDTDEDGAFGLLYTTLYPLEDLSVLAGVEYRFDNTALRVDAEYAISGCGLSIFAQGLFANDNYEHGIVGLRYYFGSDKNLQERHRQDDPRNMLKDILSGMFTYGAEYNERSKNYQSSIPGTAGSNFTGGSSSGFSGFSFGASSLN